MNWETILSWGDSITIGARSYLAYPEYAGHTLTQSTNKHWHTPIHAVCGYTACDLNRSLTPELEKFVALKPSLLTIMIGTNDLKSPTDVDSFEIAYRQLLIKAHLVCPPKQILVLPIPELKKGVMYPYQIDMNSTVKLLNSSINDLATEFGVRTLSVELEDIDLYDGVHLSESGSRNVGSQVADFVLADRGLLPDIKKKEAAATLNTDRLWTNSLSAAKPPFVLPIPESDHA